MGRGTGNAVLFVELIEARRACDKVRERRVKNEVVMANMGLARSIATRFAARSGSLTLDDLVQEGAIGLLRSVDTFDPERGFAFSTYATPWVRHYVRRAIVDTGATVRIPVHFGEVLAPLRRAEVRFYAQHGRPPIDSELFADTGQPLKKIRAARAAPRGEPSSLDAPLPDGNGAMLDTMPSEVPGPLDLLEAKRRAQQARRMVSRLPIRLREVISARFLSEAEPTLAEVGAPRGVCRERVRQLEADGLEQLRKHSAAHP